MDRVGRIFTRVVRVVTDRPIATICVVAALALGGLVAALGLQASDSTSSLLGGSSEAAKATDRFHQQFGDEAVRVLVAGPLERTLLVPDNLLSMIALEGCLSGRVPATSQAKQFFAKLPQPCHDLERSRAVRSVYGPGTFINTSANEIADGFTQQQRAAAQQGNQAAAAA